MEINRGDVFYVNRSETIGSEQRSGRPAIIVSNPECNEHSPVVEVVYLTCQYKKPMPTHVRIESIGRRSTALCEPQRGRCSLGHDCAPLSGGLFAEAVRRGNQRQYLLWPAWSETALMEV